MSFDKSNHLDFSHYIYVLWGEHFEEEVATIFVTELRRVGLGVKVIGLTGIKASGAHGVILCSDFSLSQALARVDKTACVIIPCNAMILQRNEDDPRLREFFRRAAENQVDFVVSHPDVIESTSLKALSIPAMNLQFYAEKNNNLIVFAENIARSMLGVLA